MKQKRGQTLVALLIFVIVVTTITSSAVIIMILNSVGASKYEQGIETQQMAESAAENAVLRLLRDPTYTGETLAVGTGTTTTTVTGTNPITITSTATNGNFVRKIQATATYNNNVLTLISWKELF